MIHDAKIEITCDGEGCDSSELYDMPFVYRNMAASSGFYDHDESKIIAYIEAEGWTVKDGKHFCDWCSESQESNG